MSCHSSKTKVGKRWWPRNWPWVVMLAMCCLLGQVLLPMWLEPSYAGKRVSEWFEDHVDPSDQARLASRDDYQAFNEMEGDAVPFLVRWVNVHPSHLGNAYARFFGSLPSRLTAVLPEPRNDVYYLWRRIRALEWLGRIGATQRLKAEAGEPCKKTSLTAAVPRIQTSLQDRDYSVRTSAALALMLIGAPAAPAVPDLFKLARNPKDEAAPAAVQALGAIGLAATNAVGVLAEIVAAPAPTSSLDGSHERIRIFAARALAEIGITPAEAVPALTRLTQCNNSWVRVVASLALWNRNHKDARLRSEVVSALHSDARGWIASSLGQLNTNAAPFLPELKPLLYDPDPAIRGIANRAIRRIQPAER